MKEKTKLKTVLVSHVLYYQVGRWRLWSLFRGERVYTNLYISFLRTHVIYLYDPEGHIVVVNIGIEKSHSFIDRTRAAATCQWYAVDDPVEAEVYAVRDILANDDRYGTRNSELRRR